MTEHRFGPPAQMDEDGYSVPCTYAEKAAIERAELVGLELTIAAAHLADRYDVVVSTRAYAADVLARAERFEALAAQHHQEWGPALSDAA
jgi:hypothetical protein